MPTYRVEIGGQKYRFEAADDEAMREVVTGLQQQHAEQGEEERLAASVDENPRTRGWFTDVAASAARGPLKAIQAAADLLPGDGTGGIYIGRDGISFDDGESLIDAGVDALGAPQTGTGAVTEGVSQFVTGFLATKKAAFVAGTLGRGVQFIQQWGKASVAVKATAQGAVASGVFFDGQEANLANLVQAVPALQNPVAEFLATDEETPEALGRLKNAVTDAIGGAAVEGIILAARAARAGGKVKANVTPPAPERAPEATPPKAPEAPQAKPKTDPAATPAAADDPPPATTVDALAAKEPAYADLSTDQAIDRLSRRLGITGEKLGDLRVALQRGVPGEDLEKLIDLNPKHIDWSNIRSGEDVVAVLNSVTRIMGDTVAEKAGYAPQTIKWLEEQAAKLADETGGGYKDAVGMLERVRDLPAVVIMQRKLVTASAVHLRDLAEKIRKGANTPAELLEFIAHERRHALLQVSVRGVRAQVGRALRVMQEGVKVSEDSLKLANARDLRAQRKAAGATGKVPEVPKRNLTADEAEDALREIGLDSKKVKTLADYIATHPELDEINRVARMSLFERAQEKLTTLYINNILSGMPTMAVNVFSGFYKMVESMGEQLGAAALATARGGDRFDRMVANKAIGATFTSWRAALTLAGKAWREGLPQTDVMARHEVQMRGGAPEGIVETALSLPSRTIVTIDEFFKQIFYQQELTARAVEVAAQAARLEKGKAAQDAMFKRVLADTLRAPPDDLMLDAIEKARYQTFQNNPENRLISWLMSGTNKIPAMRLILPFVKTPYNIVAQAAERSPLALLSGRVRRVLAGHEGKRAQNEMLTRMAIGTAAIGTVWNLADTGNLTGSRVGGKGLRNTADMEAPPYSVKIGDTWYQYNRLDPLGTLLGLTADLRVYYNSRQERLANELSFDDPEASEAMSAIMGIFVENLADKAFFKGISDFFEAVGNTRDGGGGAFMQSYVNNLAVNFVPYSSFLRNVTRATDEHAREAWTLMDRLRAQMPGNNEALPPRRDILGRPVTQYDRLGADWASPFVIAKDDPDPVARELAKLELPYRMPDKDIAGVKMTSEQYSRMLEVRGGIVYDAIRRRIESGAWEKLTRYQKADFMRRVFTDATGAGEAAVMRDWPEVREAVAAHRREVAAVKGGRIQ